MYVNVIGRDAPTGAPRGFRPPQHFHEERGETYQSVSGSPWPGTAQSAEADQDSWMRAGPGHLPSSQPARALAGAARSHASRPF